MEEKKSPFCTLTDQELIEKATALIQELINSGGSSWVLNIPARPNADPDLIFTELNFRFKNLVERPKPGAVWVKASERLPGWDKSVKWRYTGSDNYRTASIGTLLKTRTNLESWEWYDESTESPAEQPVDDLYDTLYYMVLPALHKLRHRTDNDSRMAAMGNDIRNTIHNTISEIKKLPQPKSANEPPYLVQSAAEQPGREVEDHRRFAHDISEGLEYAKIRMKALLPADDKEVAFILEKVTEALNKWSGGKEQPKGGMPKLDEPLITEEEFKAWEEGGKEVKP